MSLEHTALCRNSLLVAVAFCLAAIPFSWADNACKKTGDGFAAPQDALAAYQTAVAKKNWRDAFLCQSPATRGAIVFEMFFATGMNENPHLIAVIEKHLKAKWRDHGVILDSGIKLDQGWRVADHGMFYESLVKRVDDVPGFVEEFCREWEKLGKPSMFRDLGPVKQIKLDGDKAIGYGPPSPLPKPVVYSSGNSGAAKAQSESEDQPMSYLPPPFDEPQATQIDFCKVEGKWFLGTRDVQVSLPQPRKENAIPAAR